MSTCNPQLDQLRHQLSAWENNAWNSTESIVSTGYPALDAILPAGGLRRGSLVEWLAEVPGHGATTLALLCAREACRTGGDLVIVDCESQFHDGAEFYPPTLATWGIDHERLILLRPRSQQHIEWAMVQVLRSPSVAAVWGHFNQLDSHAFRRWQLAARSGGTLGLLLRPACMRREPTWADVRLLVQPLAGHQPRRVRATPLRCRGGVSKGSVELEIDIFKSGRFGKVQAGLKNYDEAFHTNNPFSHDNIAQSSKRKVKNKT